MRGTPTTERHYSGYFITAGFQAISMTVCFDGLFSVNVSRTAESYGPNATHGGLLTSDVQRYFSPDQITCTNDCLRCMGRPAWTEPNSPADFYRAGFEVDLTPETAIAVRAAFERLVPMASLMAAVYAKTDELLLLRDQRADSFNYVHGPATEAVASVFLDGAALEAAVSVAFEGYGTGSNADAVTAFRNALVVAIELVDQLRRRGVVPPYCPNCGGVGLVDGCPTCGHRPLQEALPG
jgi:hypothetical protein